MSVNPRIFPMVIGLLISAAVVAAEEQAATPSAADKNLATYKNLSLTDADLQKELTTIQKMTGTRDIPNRQVVFTLVDNLMLRKILASEAVEKGLINDEDMNNRLQRQKEIWLAQARKEDLITELTEQELDKVAYEMYLANKDKFVSPERAKISHILIKTKGRTDEEAKALAEGLLKQIQQTPTSFEELAKEHSEDKKSGRNGGKLGWAERKKFVKPFADAAFSLREKGQLSGLVKTKYGFHIIRMDEYKAEAPQTFEQVKPKLVKQAEGEIRKTSLDYYLTKTKTSPDYAYDEPAVDEFFYTRYGEGALKKLPEKKVPARQPKN